MEKLHKIGYIHCDLKPDNILIGDHHHIYKDLMEPNADVDKIISLYSFSQAGELVIASKFGYGFIVSFEDLISNRKAGKQILNLSSDDEAISSDYLKGTNIAVIGENKKMLLFMKKCPPTKFE